MNLRFTKTTPRGTRSFANLNISITFIKAVIGLLLLFGTSNALGQTIPYDFETDVVGVAPLKVTAVNGTITTADHSTEGKAMQPLTVGSANTAAFDMDNFPATLNYSVTWKETYTTAGRSGFTLRGNSANSMATGLVRGYLFQASPAKGHARIYTSDASSYTRLSTDNLTPSGPDTPRWYRATVNGFTLTFEYSDDGTNFTLIRTLVDTSYTEAGTTQFTRGYGDPISGSFVDDVVYTPISDIYDFETDTVGLTPTNITEANGTITTVTGKAMQPTAVSSGNTAAFNMDLFAAAKDYSVVWKESYTTAGRSGFTLRGNGTNSIASGIVRGYLFQASPSAGHVRIYTSNASSYTLLSTDNLAASGANTPRWYRATVAGTTLTFEYSDDGINFMLIRTLTNSDYTEAGTTQFTRGYGNSVAGASFDDVLFINNDLTVLEQISLQADSPDTVNSVVTVDQLATITPMITGLIAANETAYQDYIDANPSSFSTPTTAAEVQTMVNTVNSPTTSIIYDFEADVVGVAPANITAANGTITTVTGKAMQSTTAASGNTAAFNMDLFAAAADYAVTWKETYSTAGRSGFTLRGNGTNSIASGIARGYLFQASPSAGHVRIYTSNASSYTLLSTDNLAASGANTPRWYRATVAGTTLTFEYSDDGTNFTLIRTLTNTDYTAAGTTQYTRGYSGSTTGNAIDDVTFVNNDGAPTDAIALNNVSEYQVFQRNNANQADIVVSGTYTGSPTAIEASFNGGPYATIDASPTGGTYSGTLPAQAAGQGMLLVRFVNDTGISSSVANVGVGDIFIISGQSNASGRGNTLNSYSHPTLKAGLFGNDDNWKELADATDSNSGQVDGVSSDGIAKGSPWPIVATSIMANHGIPVAFVPTAKGGTSTAQWQPGSNHSNTSTLYGSMNRRITAVGGVVKGVLFFQGESDSGANVTQATYETRLGTIVNTIESDFVGTKTMVGQIGHSNKTGNDAIRAAQIATINANTNAVLGPATYDINLADEGGDTLHFKSDADMASFAARWYAAIDKEFYNGADGYGPILNTSGLVYDMANNKLTVPFTDDSTPAISLSSTVTANSFDLQNNGVSIAIATIAIVGNTIEITPTTVLNTTQSMTLTYASLNDAIEAAIYDPLALPAQPFYDTTITLLSTNQIIEDYAEDNTNTVPAITDYANAGVTGVDAANLAEVNAAIDALMATDVDTTAKIQEIVDTINAGNIIEQYAEDNTNTVPVITDYANAGVTGVDAANLAEVNAAIDALMATDVDTTAKIQEIVDELNTVAIVVNSSASNTLTQQELTAAGITNTGLTQNEIEKIEMGINFAVPAPSTTAELQTIVDNSLRTLGSHNFSPKNFVMFPNPSSGVVTINTEVRSITLYSLTGQKVLETTTNIFNIEALETGIYFVYIETAEGITKRRLTKK